MTSTRIRQSDTKYTTLLAARGFTMVELLVVVALMIAIAAVLIIGFANYATQKEFEATTSEVADLLYEARQRSLAGVEGVTHGVYVGTSTIELFSGSSVVPGATSNDIIVLPENITATSSLSSGASSVVFSHLRGNASATGTIVLADDFGRTATMTVLASGAFQ